MFCLVCAAAIGAIQLLNLLMRLLDELFFPGYRRVRIDPPLVITGNPRSGTTLLHRLLCLDEERFASFRLYHVLFPSVSMHRLFSLFLSKEARPVGPVRRLSAWFRRTVFSNWSRIHLTGLDQIEEDEALFFLSFASGSVYLVFPFFDEVPQPAFADGLSGRKRLALARYYRSSVRRFLYSSGRGRTFLLKSVFFSGRMNVMHAVFPDARVVYLIRHPYRTLPSFVSMFGALFWGIHSPDIPERSPQYRKWAELGVRYYRAFHRQRDIYGADRLFILDFEELGANPAGALLRIYRRLGLTAGEEFRRRLGEESERQRRYRSRHSYSLARFGLSRSWIRAELKELFEAYGLEP